MGEVSFKRCRGVVYRATTYDTPLWVSPNSRPGRWSHPENETVAQYCTLDPASAIAEMVRYEDLRDVGEASELRVDVWELRVDEGAIVDLSTPERVKRQGFAWEPLVSDSWDRCQAEGLRITSLGARGVLAPSAALPRGVTLTLFGPRTEIDWNAEPSLSIQVPARQIVCGAPGRHLVEETRFFGGAYPDVEPTAADRFFAMELAEPASGA